MKAGWEVKPLGELAKTTAGGTPKKSNKSFYEGGTIPWLVSGEVANANITESKNFITEEGLAGSSAKIYPENSVLIAMYGATAGEVGILRFKACSNQAVCAVLPNPNYLPEYLYYCLLSLQSKLAGQAIGNAQPNISQAKIKALEVPIPPIEEQKQIVAVLNAAFEGLNRAKENAEANLQNARELFDARVTSEFSALGEKFGSKRIGEVANHRLGKMLDKHKNRGKPREYLRNLNVQWFEIDTSDLLEMRIEEDEIEKYSVDQGDLLICEGGYPGRAAIWSHPDRIFYQKALHRVRFADPIYNRLLLYWLYLLDRTNKLSTHFSGAGIQHFTGKALAKFEMPFPPKEEARRVVTAIEATKEQSEEVEDQYCTKLSDIADLRQSLLHKAFAGELT